jgi:hypothetical protein
MAAAAAGAEPVVAVDAAPGKLAVARELGATAGVEWQGDAGATAEVVREASGGGVDYAIEATGRPEAMEAAFLSTRARGAAVLIGIPRSDAVLSLPATTIPRMERRVLGSIYGSSKPERDFPRTLALYRSGQLPLDRLVSHRLPLDEAAQLAHFTAAARACAPVPFYVYEFARTSGYPVALDVLRRLRENVETFAGLKVSDSPWEAFAPYLTLGVDVLVGPEALIHRGIEGGAVGAVSALASAFPAEVAAVVHEPTEDGAARLAELRGSVERFPRQAAMKRIIASRGVPVQPDVRPPLRDLTSAEIAELEAWLASS